PARPVLRSVSISRFIILAGSTEAGGVELPPPPVVPPPVFVAWANDAAGARKIASARIQPVSFMIPLAPCLRPPESFRACTLLLSARRFRRLHHRLPHAVFARPVQTDLVPVRVVQIGVPPAPRHHPRQLGDVKVLLLQLAAKFIQLSNLEVQPHSVACHRRARSGLM